MSGLGLGKHLKIMSANSVCLHGIFSYVIACVDLVIFESRILLYLNTTIVCHKRRVCVCVFKS